MNPKKYQVFVSSTYRDLVDVRRSVMERIQHMAHFPVGMEQFSADDDDQWRIIQETIQQSDYYICLVGHRYGSLAKDGRSYTEMEWDYAKEIGVPIMSFIRDRNAKTSPDEREKDHVLAQKLNDFVVKVSANKMVDSWDEEADLNAKVVIALYKAFSRKPRPGWIRSTSDDVAEALATLSNENRALRSDVERLTSQAAQTKPDIAVFLNGVTELVLTYVSDEELSLSIVPTPKALNWDDISNELKPFVREEDVRVYNRELPPQTEIDDQYQKIRAFERGEQTKCDLKIAVANTGQAKARELYVDLVFPDSVLVMEKYDYEKAGPPQFSLPDNPIPRAEAKLRESKRQLSVYDMFNDLGSLHGITTNLVPHRVLSDFQTIASVNRGHSLDAKDGKITIWIKDLMHTRQVDFDDVIIIPQKPGVFEVKASVISEEMNTPIRFTIPLKIVEKQ